MISDYSSIPNILSYTTIRLDCINPDGERSLGTGFHFKFDGNDNSVIVTNKHVVKNSMRGIVYFTTKNNHGEPQPGNHFAAILENFKNAWIPHPEPDVDIAAIPISRLEGVMMTDRERARDIFFPSVSEFLIPNKDQFKALRLIEDVVMVGYPIGLWDEHNNFPIVRRGVTATHPAFDFNGREEFLIDCACFPGSSGSPVFRYVPELSIEAGQGLSLSGGGARLDLLGVLYAGPQHNAEGEIEIVEIPTASTAITSTNIPINIGKVIRSDKILDFKKLI